MITNFYNYFLPDSNITSITIENDKVVICLEWDVTKKPIRILCSDVVGITNLCMWDDTIIGDNVSLMEVDAEKEGFLSQIFSVYRKDYGCEVYKSLKNHLFDLSIELVNTITFHVYCYEVWIEENTGDSSLS